MLSGGDTALGVLDRLGSHVVFPEGEAAPGLPWFAVETGGRTLSCIVKSGGFGMADVLAESSLTPDQRRYVDIFQRAATSLLDLLNDTLDMSKIEAGQLTLETVVFNLRV